MPIIRKDSPPSLLDLSTINVHVCIRRYFAARDFLASQGQTEIGFVMLADLRDVIF